MKNRVQTWKILFCSAFCVAALNSTSLAQAQVPAPPPPAGSVAAQANAMADQALDLLNSGKLKEAADIYSGLILKYPTSARVPEALFRLGYIQYVQGDYPTAVSTLQRIVSPPATLEVKTAGDALIPQVTAAAAAKLPPEDPGRPAAFQNAISQFAEFIKKYPKSAEVASAEYGQAVAAFQIQDFTTAEQSLRDNIKSFPNSESILDTKDLLAVVLTAEASDILKKGGENKDAAFAKFNEALNLLGAVIGRHTDVALANDAQFQAGEVLFARGNAEMGEQSTKETGIKDITSAINVYRDVQPKDAMIQAQQTRVQALLGPLRQAQYSRNQAVLQNLQSLQDRENAKLEALKTAQDQTLNAQLRIAACYFILQKNDEARVLLKYLQSFAETDLQKKQIAYYMAMTYAAQAITDKALAAYNDFQAKYKNDPLGENLPLALGTAFLNAKPSQPDKAISYFQEEMTLYPKSSLVNSALEQEAAALIGLKRYDDALSTYQKFLATNPPKSQAVGAELGIANIYQAKQQIPEAIKQYQKIATDYPDSPQAEQSAFYAAGLQISVDMKAALPALQDFVKKYPKGKYAPQAMIMIGQVQGGTGDSAAAMKSFQDVIDKFPKSEYAPESYFAMAAILGKDGKSDEMVKLMKDFIVKYPDDKDIYYAYDTIGQTEVTKGEVADAIAVYTEMAEKHPENPSAPAALYRTADLWRKQAESLGHYAVLDDAHHKEWSKDLDASVAASEKLIDKFPDSEQVGVALKNLITAQDMEVEAQVKTADNLDQYFRVLAAKYAKNPALKSRILFSLATYTYKKDPAKAMANMNIAYNPSLVYAPEDLDVYGEALFEKGKLDDAFKIYQKIAADYPNPENVPANQAPLAIQQAQAIALFGMGNILDKQGKTADAGKLLTQLKTTYPWSPKVMEANFGIAKSLAQQNKFDDALKLLLPIASNRNVPVAMRARAMILTGDVNLAKGNLEGAIDSYLKTAAFYEGVPDAASEGLWKGAQALEKQATKLTEQTTPKQSEQISKAVADYKQLVSKYPGTEYVQKAEDRLNVLPAK